MSNSNTRKIDYSSRELQSKLPKGGLYGEDIGEYFRGYEVGDWELRL